MSRPEIAEIKHDFSGRDAHIIASALAYTNAVIDALPRELAALSDQDDMKAMLDDMIWQDSELGPLHRSVAEAHRRLAPKTANLDGSIRRSVALYLGPVN